MAAAGGLGASLKASARSLGERQIPLAGLTAAFIFALQMINFPVAAGTSGHLLGGALAAILLGPSVGITVVSVVVIVQALLFADGGISAVGLNVFNMAILTAAVGWLVFRGALALLPRRSPSVLVAVMMASWASVVASSLGFVVEYAIGGQGGVDIGTVFGAMVGVHAVIGVGEGLITATVIGAVMAVRPDLVSGVSSYGFVSGAAAPARKTVSGFVAAGMIAALVLVIFVAPIASSDPDGLERVAVDQGFNSTAEDSAIGDSPLADYGVAGVEDDRTGTVVAGVIGTVLVFAVGTGLFLAVRRKRAEPTAGAGP